MLKAAEGGGATEPGLGHASRCHGFDIAAQGGERDVGSSAFCVERAGRESATRHDYVSVLATCWDNVFFLPR